MVIYEAAGYTAKMHTDSARGEDIGRNSPVDADAQTYNHTSGWQDL